MTTMRAPRDQNPRKARRDYLDSKAGSLKASTIRCYEIVTADFVEFLEENGIEGTQEIDGYIVHQWILKRKEDDDVAPVTLQNNVRHLRVFLKWCEACELVEEGLYEKIEVPSIHDDQERSDKTVSPIKIQSILSHLELYEYATRLHAATKFLWHTGCRISGAVALDLRDYNPEENYIAFRNRREVGTPLKNGKKSERNVTLSEGVIEVLNDYIQGRREDVTDEYDRKPLFTTTHGRMTRQRMYKNFVAVSRPCVYDNYCPHGRETTECTAAVRKKRAFECPSSDPLHPIRRGSITYHLNQGWPIEDVSERCDVSQSVLEKHYDVRTHEDKRHGRQQFVDKL
jgi:site-specific recombinase XerD